MSLKLSTEQINIFVNRKPLALFTFFVPNYSLSYNFILYIWHTPILKHINNQNVLCLHILRYIHSVNSGIQFVLICNPFTYLYG